MNNTSTVRYIYSCALLSIPPDIPETRALGIGAFTDALPPQMHQSLFDVSEERAR